MSLQKFRARYPEFKNRDEYPEERVCLFMEDATIIMDNKDRWLCWYEQAHAALTAHLLSLSDASATGDSDGLFPAKRQEVDDVIVESAIGNIDPTKSASYFMTTIYGQQYYKYVRWTFTGIYGV